MGDIVGIAGDVIGAVAPVNPGAVGGLDLWVAADEFDPSLADGTAIALWPDLSGNGHSLSQGVAGNQPLLKLGILNGLPIVRFDGSNDSLGGVVTASAGKTIFAVARKRTNPGAADKHLWTLAQLARINCISSVDATRWYVVQNSAGSGVVLSAATCLAWHIIALDYVSLTSILPYVDGAQQAGFDPNDTYSTSIAFTLADNPSAHGYGDIDLAEVVVYSRSLATVELLSVFGYLDWKWRIY